MTIRSLVEREQRHLQRTEVATGGLLAAAIIAVLVSAAGALFDHARWLALPRGLPVLVWLVAAAAAIGLGLRTRKRLRDGASRRDVALAIELEQGMRRGQLVGALELEGQSALAERAASRVRTALPQGEPLAPALRRASSRRTIVGAAAAAAGLLVLLSTSPLFADGLKAVFRPIDAWRGSLLDRPRIDGAPAELVRGSPLRVTVRAAGRRVVFLQVRQTGDAWRTDTLSVDPKSGVARWAVESLRGDLRLVASDGRTTSDSTIVRAADRPFVGAVTLHAHYPGYLSRADELLPVGEPLRLPRGTIVSITGRASVPLADVALTAAGGEHFGLEANGQSFRGRLAPERSMQLKWSARGPTGLVPDLPEPLNVEVLADSAPHVVINEPSGDTLLVANTAVELALRVSDDHGVASVALRIVRGDSRDAVPIMQPVAGVVGTSWGGVASVDIDALHLSPGDAVRVRAEAVDASPWAQRGVSRELVLRRATSEEQRAAARALGDSAVRQAQDAAIAQRSLAQRTNEAARAQARQAASTENTAGTTPSAPQKAMNFENAEKARSLAKEQRAMSDRVQKLKQATQQLEAQLKAAGALDTSLARQLGEAQSLLRQALTPEMMAQMQKLESASRQMNGDQSRDALRDLAQMQVKLREQLERSAEMLKRAAHEGAMQTLGDDAKELGAKERALADSGRRADPSKSGADGREAQQLAERAERLREAMDELKERLAKDKADVGASKTDQAQQHAAKSESDMQQAANEMRAGEQKDQAKPGPDATPGADAKPGSGSKSGSGQSKRGEGRPKSGQQGARQANDAAAAMDQAAKDMQDARSAQVKEWKQELTTELDQSVQEMMQLARQERSLEQQARSGASSDDRRGEQSAVEQGVDKASERLQGAGKKSALLSSRSQRAVSDAKTKVSQATESVSQPTSTAQKQASALGDAADALTKAAASLARDRENANNANSASGFSEMMKEMQDLAQKQGQINGQAQSLMMMPTGMGSAAGQSLARSLARQQRQLAERLEDAGDASGGDRAAQLAQEARDLAEALDNGRLDGTTLARQQQLFRRLLDAGKSLEKEERDDNGKREAKSATGSDAFSPGAKVDTHAAVRFRPPTWQELRGLSADERRTILDYFTRLNSGSPPTS